MSNITVAQEVASTANGAASIAANITVAAGSTVQVSCLWQSATITAAVSDSVNGSYGAGIVGPVVDGVDGWTGEAWCFQNSSGAALVVTVTFTGGSPGFTKLLVAEVTGVRLTAQPDQVASSNVLSTPNTTDGATAGPTPTLNVAPALLYGICADLQGTAAIAAGTGFTAGNGNTTLFATRSEWKRVTSTAGVTATFTIGTNNESTIVMAIVYDELPLPVFVYQPTTQISPVGGSVTFNGLGTGTGTVHYQWTRGGSNVGTDSPSITFSGLKQSDSGAAIAVTITDNNGSVTSSTVFIAIQPVDVFLYQPYPLSNNDVVLRDPSQFDHLPFWGVEVGIPPDAPRTFQRPLGEDAFPATTPAAPPASMAPFEVTPRFTPSRAQFDSQLTDDVTGTTPKTPTASYFEETTTRGKAPRARTEEALVLGAGVALAPFFDQTDAPSKKPRARTDEAVGITPKTPTASYFEETTTRGQAPRARTDEAAIPEVHVAPWYEDNPPRGKQPRARTDEAVGVTPKTPTASFFEETTTRGQAPRARTDEAAVLQARYFPWFEQIDVRGIAPRARTDEAVGVTPKIQIAPWFEQTDVRGRAPRARTDEALVLHVSLAPWFDQTDTRGKAPRARTDEALGLPPLPVLASWFDQTDVRGKAPRARTDEAMTLRVTYAPWFEQRDPWGKAPRARTDEAMVLDAFVAVRSFFEDVPRPRPPGPPHRELELHFLTPKVVVFTATFFDQGDPFNRQRRVRADEAMPTTALPRLASWLEVDAPRSPPRPRALAADGERLGAGRGAIIDEAIGSRAAVRILARAAADAFPVGGRAALPDEAIGRAAAALVARAPADAFPVGGRAAALGDLVLPGGPLRANVSRTLRALDDALAISSRAARAALDEPLVIAPPRHRIVSPVDALVVAARGRSTWIEDGLVQHPRALPLVRIVRIETIGLIVIPPRPVFPVMFAGNPGTSARGLPTATVGVGGGGATGARGGSGGTSANPAGSSGTGAKRR